MPSEQITTVVFFKYRGIQKKWWGLTQMAVGPDQLKNIEGQQLFKLMGSGSGEGFSLWPDWSTYSLLQIWDNEQAAQRFFDGHSFFEKCKAQSQLQKIIYLKAVKAHGNWDAKNPFDLNGQISENKTMAVLTRATINPSKLISFWKHVPAASRAIANAPGLLFSKGVGEYPVFMQATISIWESRQYMVNYAYQNKDHAKVIKKTREENWYSEELFAEFEVMRLEGFAK